MDNWRMMRIKVLSVIHPNEPTGVGYNLVMLKRLYQYVLCMFGKGKPSRRTPLYDAQDPRQLARQRNNRVYLKNIKQHQKSEKNQDNS